MPEKWPEWMTTEQTAEYVGKSAGTLEQHRSKGYGLPYTVFSRRVLYKKADIDAVLEAAKVIPGAENAAAGTAEGVSAP